MWNGPNLMSGFCFVLFHFFLLFFFLFNFVLFYFVLFRLFTKPKQSVLSDSTYFIQLQMVFRRPLFLSFSLSKNDTTKSIVPILYM